MIINPRGATLNCAKIAGFEREQIIEVNRTIDKRLLELNAQGFLNGHTPFSAMLAFVSLLTSAITKMKHVALSNESSANESTVFGQDVNHQYSKSLEFETDFRDYVKNYISDDFDYYSFLRPYNELQIAELFSKFPQYHSVFRSCNAGSKDDIWCNNCPKCLFAYIILSPFIEPQKMIEIFGTNLLNKENLKHEFNQLVGTEKTKPFECVGTIDEVNTALNLYIQRFPNHTSELIEYYKTLYHKKIVSLQHETK
jgi:ssDNA-binding Zn-finger/Zn-ribbon topoisomerase 1